MKPDFTPEIFPSATDKTRALLKEHFALYPKLGIEDVFKFLFQSAFGCEHLVSDEAAVLDYIRREYETSEADEPQKTEPLDGEYSRVYLSCLSEGLRPETLARLFYLSAKKEEGGKAALEQKLAVARELILSGELPLDIEEFDRSVDFWREKGYPPVRHSEVFRGEYRPAYRVVSNRFVKFIGVFSAIDRARENGRTTVAIEGGSAAGKSTLAAMLAEVYDCNIFHMDDFFLRPEQRTPERFAEVGGNVDRERFLAEVLAPLAENEPVTYCRFDCSAGKLSEPITVQPKPLTVIEGAYSMHEAFGSYFDVAVFLDVTPECQKSRIQKRNTPAFAKRFFEEWIPLEVRYFDKMRVKSRSTISITVE